MFSFSQEGERMLSMIAEHVLEGDVAVVDEDVDA
jgi:hypothetical protein